MPAEIIKLDNIPPTSGVYQFFDAKDRVLYVGKAKNLYKRVASYTKTDKLSQRISHMVFLAQKLEIIQTENEVEALLLEHNLIKKLEPRYNILLRDDKTFPYIHITKHNFPQITKYRGPKKDDGFYFGPFASAHDVNHTIDVLRKSFLLRNCSDAEFKSRKKPCLEYQIKKCFAPCVNLVLQNDYETAVKNAVEFLNGKSAEVQKNLLAKMQKLSAEEEFEKAAIIRDQIKSLNSIQTKQNINLQDIKNVDIITLKQLNNMTCVYISFYRNGQNYGAKPYFYEIDSTEKQEEFLSDFLGQFYLNQIPASEIFLNLEIAEQSLMEEFLSKLAGCKVIIKIPKIGSKLALIKDQEKIALQNIEQKILQNLNNRELLLEIKKAFDLPKMPQKIEVYDNSHTSGSNAVGVLITADINGFVKSGYRKFNIKSATPNSETNILYGKDDTAMMREVLFRRFSKLDKSEYPDLIILDGGKPQLSAAQAIFDELKIKIPFICMAKGENRNAGEEKFHQTNKEIVTFPKNHPALHYLQRLRDEAHRFAIMTHRKKRSKETFLWATNSHAS